MRNIISLQGPMASGKTTLAKRLEQRGMRIVYENPYPIVQKRKEMQLDIGTKEGFIANQKLFIESKIKEFQQLSDDIIIFDRGPEDIEFYTLYYPKLIGKDWDMEKEMINELRELRKCRSQAIFYLSASKEVLQKRKESDDIRQRSTFEEQMKLIEIEKSWYEQFPVTYLNVDAKLVEEVEHYFIKWLGERGGA
ncbi:ATP-binding protein [Bacillus sp. AFS018417]|uniref:AAA family ATPase n=1 Tax=Bacillus sp. AFS018417 TaxID=2033491 RepID=UPI000BF697D8|nr:AAA family ATPase [Bacillus sp. AFS018417]PEZ08489.1 ATP-binding protein [Bacillus sp. AFS018417]